jgi:uncharacterized protein (TIGR02145 family)
MKTINNSYKKIHSFKASMASITYLLFLVFPSCQKYELNQDSILSLDNMSSSASAKKDKPKDGIMDVEGNIYKTVKIGQQWWMAENLKAALYNDGSRIMRSPDDPPAPIPTPDVRALYYWYNDDASTYKDSYGALYNWYAVNATTIISKNICPTGWHVPSDAEWHTLIMFLDHKATSLVFPDYESETAGGLLKEAGLVHWLEPNTGATNKCGFTALPGGITYAKYPEYLGMNTDGYWWSSTEHVDIEDNAYGRYILYNSGSVYKDRFAKTNALSVRCIMDN